MYMSFLGQLLLKNMIFEVWWNMNIIPWLVISGSPVCGSVFFLWERSLFRNTLLGRITYPHPAGMFESMMIFQTSRLVGYVNSLEGIYIYIYWWCVGVANTNWMAMRSAFWSKFQHDLVTGETQGTKKTTNFLRFQIDRKPVILLMDKILHHQSWWLSHYL